MKNYGLLKVSLLMLMTLTCVSCARAPINDGSSTTGEGSGNGNDDSGNQGGETSSVTDTFTIYDYASSKSWSVSNGDSGTNYLSIDREGYEITVDPQNTSASYYSGRYFVSNNKYTWRLYSRDDENAKLTFTADSGNTISSISIVYSYKTPETNDEEYGEQYFVFNDDKVESNSPITINSNSAIFTIYKSLTKAQVRIEGFSIVLNSKSNDNTGGNTGGDNTGGNTGGGTVSNLSNGWNGANDAVKAYYSSVSETDSGSSLMQKLNTKIKSTHNSKSYDALYDCYKTSDKRPNTNHLWDMYTDYNQIQFTIGSDECHGNYSGVGDNYNREHVVPQSWHAGSEKTEMKCDAHHVIPTDSKLNGDRGNNPHGNVPSGTALKNSKGTIKIAGGICEVEDEYKGDFARMYLYFACRYLSDLSSVSKTVENKSGTNPVFIGSYPYLTTFGLNTYLTWSKNDPVSQKEIDRNNAVYAHQGNRNPFIDNSYFEVMIWGDYIN